MKKILVAFLLFNIIMLQAQTADEIIDRYFEKIGGAENWRKLTGIKSTLSMKSAGKVTEYQFKDGRYAKISNGFLYDSDKVAYDGNVLWSIVVDANSNLDHKPEVIKDSAWKENIISLISDFPDPLLDYNLKDHKATLEGRVKVGSTECYKISLERKPLIQSEKPIPNITYYYFDVKEYLPVLIEGIDLSSGTFMQRYVSDYRPVNGLLFPFKTNDKVDIEGYYKGAITSKYTSYELNPVISQDFFSFPEANEVTFSGLIEGITTQPSNLKGEQSQQPQEKIRNDLTSSYQPEPDDSTRGGGASEKKSLDQNYNTANNINSPSSKISEPAKVNPTVSNPNAVGSDVDINIPTGKLSRPDAIAVVIGNRDYTRTKPVDFAINDARIMKNYLVKTLGFQEGNILYYENATKGDFEMLFGTDANEKGRLFNTVMQDVSDVFVFYSGHGAPGLKDQKGYFVPVECDPNYVEFSGFDSNVFYKNLGKLPAKSVTVVLDACFSGANVFSSISPIVIKAQTATRSEKISVLGSSSGTEVSSWYNEKGHGLFTYFFLKSLQDKTSTDKNKDGQVSLSEIHQVLSDNTRGIPYWARRIHGIEQHPTLEGKNTEFVLFK